MNVSEFLTQQEPARKKLLSSIHKIISDSHPKLKPRIGSMMGKEMILYEIDGAFTYALASVKDYMSLHNIIMYMQKPIHAKYSKLLGKAKFQKGCVNFENAEQVPLNVIKEFMADSAKGIPAYLEMHKARMAKKK